MRETLETSGMNEMDDRRSAQGTLVRPRQQLKYAMILVCGGVLAQSVIIGSVVFVIHRSIQKVTELYQLDPQIGDSITNSITSALTLTLLVGTAIAMAAILIGIRLSHRIYGPMVPFRRHIDALKKGEFSSRIRLRKDDDLIEIRDALNDLAITLEERYKNR
jgi:signal transduction histidine kinase